MSNQKFFQETLSSEIGKFHNVVAAFPDAKLDYRHDPKSRSVKELVSHLIGHFGDIVELIDDGKVNHRNQVPFKNIAEALSILDRDAQIAADKLKKVSDADWAAPSDFIIAGKKLMTAPRQAVAWMLFLDAVHHRGQLSTQIRPTGGKVPSIYGPSADTAVG